MLAGGLISTNTWPMVIVDQEPTNALATGHSRTYSLNVLPATAGQEEATNYGLRFTLVWTDPPGNPNVGVKLVNDLDRNLSHGPSFCIHQHIGLPIIWFANRKKLPDFCQWVQGLQKRSMIVVTYSLIYRIGRGPEANH